MAKPSPIEFIATAILVATTAQVPVLAQEPKREPAKTNATELKYQSAFDNYRRMDDMKLGSWKAANDKVTEIGGWREYLKQVQSNEQKPAVPENTPSSTEPKK